MKQVVFASRGLALIALSSLLLTTSACNKDKDKDENYDIPTTYNFENVSYTGQLERLDMLGELGTYMRTAHVANAPALDASTLKNMYRNENSPFTAANLNNSSKQLKDKTAMAYSEAVELWLDSMAAASAYTGMTSVEEGQPGLIFKNDGSAAYLLNSKGMEVLQIVEKGLMAACFYYQASAVYLGEGKMNVDNETVVPGEGTDMEHHFDEAFGYFGAPIDFPTNTDGLRFWARYCDRRDPVLGTNSAIMNAFLAGRAAISNKDMARRDIEITRVRRYWEQVVGGTALNYLNSAKRSFNDDKAVVHHALSEGFAFIFSLKFGGDALISASEVDNILIALFGSADPLEANVYAVTETRITTAINALANVLNLQDKANDL